MPSGLKRYYGKGHLHFITFSCYQRRPLLKSTGARDVLVQELHRVRKELQFHRVGYVVMPEHVHLLIGEQPEGTPSTVLHQIETTRGKAAATPKEAETRRADGTPICQMPGAAAKFLAGSILRFQCV